MRARILLIDDEEIILNGWTKALKSTGHTILRAKTKAEALEIAEKGPLDLVIVDYLMGKVTGIEILSLIRKKHPMVRSILISAQIDRNINEGDVKDLIRDKVEVDKYLHKPVRSAALREAVASLLASKEIGWQEWAERAKAAREAKPEDTAEAEGRLKPHLKKQE